MIGQSDTQKCRFRTFYAIKTGLELLASLDRRYIGHYRDAIASRVSPNTFGIHHNRRNTILIWEVAAAIYRLACIA